MSIPETGIKWQRVLNIRDRHNYEPLVEAEQEKDVAVNSLN